MEYIRFLYIGGQVAITVIFLLFYSSATAAVKPAKIAKQKWFQVTTENFVVIIDANKKVAHRVTQNLEKFRSLFALFNGGELPVTGRPVKVFITKRKGTYELMTANKKGLKKTQGFFHDTLNGNYAALRLQNSSDMSTLFHEYTHYLVSNSQTDNLPYWYNEGLAEFLGKIEFKSDTEVHYGKVDVGHLNAIAQMHWASMEDIFTARHVDIKDPKRRYQTYSQGWLAVHYFKSTPEKRRQLNQYLKLVRVGTPEREALQQAVGMNFSQLNSALRAYSRKGRLYYSKLTLIDPLTLSELDIKALSPAEISYQLGELFLQSQNAPAFAKAFFDQALTHDGEHIGALTGLANVIMNSQIDDNYSKALLFIEQARQIDATDTFAATINGHINTGLMFQTEDPLKRKQYRKKAIRSYNVAINSGVINLEAISAAANLYAGEGRWDKALELYTIAYEFAPSNYQARTSMIWALIANNDLEQAEKIAMRVRNNNHFSDKGLEAFEKWYAQVKAEYLSDR